MDIEQPQIRSIPSPCTKMVKNCFVSSPSSLAAPSQPHMWGCDGCLGRSSQDPSGLSSFVGLGRRLQAALGLLTRAELSHSHRLICSQVRQPLGSSQWPAMLLPWFAGALYSRESLSTASAKLHQQLSLGFEKVLQSLETISHLLPK